MAALVELTCETDFVAKGKDFVATVGALAQLVADQGEDGLADQPFQDSTVAETIGLLVATLGEKIELGRVVRYETDDGLLDGYKHIQNERGTIGVLVEVGGVDRSDPKARELAHDLALHIASAAPRYVRREDVSADAIEKEREVLTELTAQRGQAGSGDRQDRRGSPQRLLQGLRAARAGLRAGPEGHRRRTDREPRPEGRGPAVHPRQGGRGIGSVLTRTRECR